MDIVYQLQGVEFEWNENKARSNAQNLRARRDQR